MRDTRYHRSHAVLERRLGRIAELSFPRGLDSLGGCQKRAVHYSARRNVKPKAMLMKSTERWIRSWDASTYIRGEEIIVALEAE